MICWFIVYMMMLFPEPRHTKLDIYIFFFITERQTNYIY